MVTNRAPFIHGGAEELCHHLVRNLLVSGVEAEALPVPFAWEPAERLIEEMMISRNIRLTNVDRVIALKFPAYLIPHGNKVLWLLHQYRQAYDLWDAGYSNVPRDERGERIRDAIRQADQLAFSEMRRIYTISQTTADRLAHYNRVQGTVLPYPLNDPELFSGGESEGYVLASGRVNAAKRQLLLVRALRHAPNVRLIVAGPPDTLEDAEALQQAVVDEGVEDRVRLVLSFLPRPDLAQLVNRALAVAYLPFQEDSVGYVTMEAFQAEKPVLTTADAGGVLEIVRDGISGLVVPPEAEDLASAMVRLQHRPAEAKALGRNGKEILREMGLHWAHTIDRLLA